jgi:hypothetical protein
MPEERKMSLVPWTAGDEANRKLPALRYAHGVVAVAGAISLIIYYVGNVGMFMRLFWFMMLAMIGLHIFDRIVKAASPSAQRAAEVLTWIVVMTIGICVTITISALTMGWPCAWIEVIGVEDRAGCDTGVDTETMEKDFWRAPGNVSPSFR